ncbi:hypothetical protein RCC89_16945 [Cytophagaceae bacterium ABcell3]|nr:hypothetical protein RCC89_16945 [Cytophagaceae bacterium ABcell3]
MKKFLLLIGLICSITSIQAQSLTRGSILSDIGVGYGSYRWFSEDAPSANDSWQVPVRLTYNIHEKVGITSFFQYNRISNRLPYRVQALNVGIGSTLHLFSTDIYTLSTSFVVGYSNLSMRNGEDPDLASSAPGVSFIGAVENRFWLTHRLALLASIGYGGYHYANNVPQIDQFPFRVTGMQGTIGVTVKAF